jgi:ATP-dependent RNA circularization protein (DNA/RNA ligase family)
MNHYISTGETIGTDNLYVVAVTDDERNIEHLRYFLSNGYRSSRVDRESLPESTRTSIDTYVTEYFNQYKNLL